MKPIRIVFYTALLLTSISVAQTQYGDVVADIPFPFIVAGQTLPAGHYIVSTVSDHFLKIKGPTTPGVFVSTNISQRSRADNSCKLVFHHYEDSYFLSQIWVNGNDRGRELPRSRAERELAAKVPAGENAVVAAR